MKQSRLGPFILFLATGGVLLVGFGFWRLSPTVGALIAGGGLLGLVWVTLRESRPSDEPTYQDPPVQTAQGLAQPLSSGEGPSMAPSLPPPDPIGPLHPEVAVLAYQSQDEDNAGAEGTDEGPEQEPLDDRNDEKLPPWYSEIALDHELKESSDWTPPAPALQDPTPPENPTPVKKKSGPIKLMVQVETSQAGQPTRKQQVAVRIGGKVRRRRDPQRVPAEAASPASGPNRIASSTPTPEATATPTPAPTPAKTAKPMIRASTYQDGQLTGEHKATLRLGGSRRH